MNSILPALTGLLPIAIASVASQESETSLGVWWILGAAAAAVMFNQLITAWNNLTGRFKERENNGPEYVTRQACHEAHEKLENCLKEQEHAFETKLTEFRNEFGRGIKGVHQRVDSILSAVSELKGRVESK